MPAKNVSVLEFGDDYLVTRCVEAGETFLDEGVCVMGRAW